MDDLEFIKKYITSQFKDFAHLKHKHKMAQKLMRKADKKIKSFQKEYSFINDIIKENSHDNLLVAPVKILLKKAGFQKVIHYKDKKQKTKREDIQAWYGKEIFIIEVKSTKNKQPARVDLLQIIPYLNGNKNRYTDKKVYGLVIFSHERELPISNRMQTFKHKEIENDILNSHVSCISIVDLLLHFRQLKAGKIRFKEFRDQLKKFGLLTYSSTGGKTLEKQG